MNARNGGTIAILSILALGGIACDKKLSPEAVAAQAAAKAADDRVARLEAQLAELKAGKHNKNDHALGGAAIGAAAGTAAAAATADTVVRIKAATPLTFTLSAPEKVTIKN